MPDPGDALALGGHHAATLDCGSGWQIHPRVSLLYLDAALAIVNKGPGLISVPAPNCDLSALSILADFLAGKAESAKSRRRRKIIAVRLSPAATLSGSSPGSIYQRGLLHGHEPCRTPPSDRAIKAHAMKREYIAFVEGRSGTPTGTWRQWLQLSRDELHQEVLSKRSAGAPGSEAREAITHYEVIAEYPLAGGERFVSKLRFRLETGRNIKYVCRPRTPDSHCSATGPTTRDFAVLTSRKHELISRVRLCTPKSLASNIQTTRGRA